VKGKWIVVDKDIYQQLKGLSEQGQTFSQIIRRLIESYETQAATKEEVASIADTKPYASNIGEQDEREESWEI
jgi:predicted CopG family antitoxin